MSIATCYWAPEIETSMVALLWHHPEFVDFVHLELDVELHFLSPALRIVLEAISVVYWNIGDADWSTVVHAIREMGAIDTCGGVQGLNDIFTDGGRYYDGRTDPQPVVLEYMELLKAYGAQRQEDPTKIIPRFTGGKGRLWPNKTAKRATDPSDLGEAFIRGHRYKIRGWWESDGLSMKFYPEAR